MLQEYAMYLGPAAGILTSILWTITALFFTAGGKRIGVTAVNAIRIGVGAVLLGLTHRALTGQWVPDALAHQVFLLALSGILGLTIGDHALFASFVYIGPRLAMLIMATAPIMATLFGWIALNETLSYLAWSGMLLAIGGIVWVVLERQDERTVIDRSHRAWGVVWALVAAICQAGGYMLSKQGMGHGWLPPEQHMDPQAAAFIRMTFAGLGVIPVIFWYRLRHRPQDMKGKRPLRIGSRSTGVLLTLCGGVVGPYLGMWMSLVAVDLTPLGVAQTLCSLTPVLILPFAILVQKERVSPRATIGAFVAVAGSALLFLTPGHHLPSVVLKHDDTIIRESCRISIPEGCVIEDLNGDGVIHVASSDITIEFAEGSILCGAPFQDGANTYDGFGICIDGHTCVTIRGATIRGYRCAIRAERADGLIIEDTDASHCRRARLRSTTTAEDTADWLSPHHNDQHEWLNKYGAALYLETSDAVVVRRCRVHHGQNGLCLDRVSHARVFDNDFSFNSGWGIALWRSSHNTLSRNACDFCIRGYSHGVYNRGQDSAGILLFEQCSNNVIVENSATHCGDGLFAFAGNEALGQAPAPSAEFDYARQGVNDNLIMGNDFSYAAAHGLELTFSFGNRILNNRMMGNAICGIWGGYSQDTIIAGNHFEANGDAGYGLERGGINIEHGRANRIIHNTFEGNTCGVHLWWDADEPVTKLPWAKANGTASTENVIADNTFIEYPQVFHFRGESDVTIGSHAIRNGENGPRAVKLADLVKAEDCVRITSDPELHLPTVPAPSVDVLGKTRPVGARTKLAGREKIILGEWGPWNYVSPMVRTREDAGAIHVYEMFMLEGEPSVVLSGENTEGIGDELNRYIVSATAPGVHPYTLSIRAGERQWVFHRTLVEVEWNVVLFPWSDKTDPRIHLDAWRSLAEGGLAVRERSTSLCLPFGSGGPDRLFSLDGASGARASRSEPVIGRDHFGMIARAKVPVPAGEWTLRTLSDDGIRVLVDNQPLIENWTWHAPSTDEATLRLDEDRELEIVVEYFEIDGYAVCEFDIALAHTSGQ